MKKILSALSAIVFSLSGNGQTILKTDGTDSLKVDLGEVRVESAARLSRADRNLYFPKAEQRAKVTNAVGLLSEMQLPGLQVDKIFNNISVAGGGKVLLFINGREVQMADVVALAPDDIVRIEHYDNPSARYGDAQVVINFKVRHAQRGASINADLLEAVNTIYGVDYVSAKVNSGANELSVNYNIRHASFRELYNMNNETYLLESGDTIHQREEGIPGRYRYHVHNVQLNYNYMPTEKKMFNIALRGLYNETPQQDLTSNITNSAFGNETFKLENFLREHKRQTDLDLYFQRTGETDNVFIAGLTGSYTSTRSNTDYHIFSEEKTLMNYRNNVDGRKVALIGELLYEQPLAAATRLTIGAKGTYGRAHNKYSGTAEADNKMQNIDAYAYAELSRKTDKWLTALSLGGSLLHASQADESYTKVLFRPVLRLGFTPNEKITLRYRASIEGIAPSLSELSAVAVRMDNYQTRQGNPQLKPSTELKNQLTFDFHHKQHSIIANLNYDYRRNPIMEQTIRQGETFVRKMDNQKSWQRLNGELTAQGYVMYGLFSYRITAGVDHFRSCAAEYNHTHTNPYIAGYVQLAYKFIALTGDITTHRPHLYGEQLALGEDLHDVALTYFRKNFTASIAMNNPFADNYRVGSENWNKQAGFENYFYINETSKLIALKVTWNAEFGKSKKRLDRRFQNSDTDTGVVKGK